MSHQVGKKDEGMKGKCRPVLTLMNTYTSAYGMQSPRTIYTKRCQGGYKNPENYQCQPSKTVIDCFHTKNYRGEDEILGMYSHEECEERCICGRKSCKNKKTYELICPKGYDVTITGVCFFNMTIVSCIMMNAHFFAFKSVKHGNRY